MKRNAWYWALVLLSLNSCVDNEAVPKDPNSTNKLNNSTPDAGFKGEQSSTQITEPEEIKSTRQRNTNPQISMSDLAAQVAGNTEFALNLYHQMQSSKDNLFFSPYSISQALVMLYGGAKNTTAQQIAAALHFSLPPERLHPVFNKLDLELSSRGKDSKATDGQSFQLNLANALWGEKTYSILPSYLDLLAENYSAGLKQVDFIHQSESARQTINDWVENKTQGKIKDLLQKGTIDQETRLVLTNAIYFNAAWKHAFNKAWTSSQAFFGTTSENMVQMMYQKIDAPYVAGTNYQAIQLPYDGDELSMLVVMPNDGEFDNFQNNLSNEQLQNIVTSLSPTPVTLSLPQFELTDDFQLKEQLSALGMKEAFTLAADLSGIDGIPGSLKVSEVVHKAFIKVNESGTEAAAATAVINVDAGMSMPLYEVNLMVDHPFLFFIRDHATGTVLFLGHVRNL
jgi:serpin B